MGFRHIGLVHGLAFLSKQDLDTGDLPSSLAARRHGNRLAGAALRVAHLDQRRLFLSIYAIAILQCYLFLIAMVGFLSLDRLFRFGLYISIRIV